MTPLVEVGRRPGVPASFREPAPPTGATCRLTVKQQQSGESSGSDQNLAERPRGSPDPGAPVLMVKVVKPDPGWAGPGPVWF